MPTLSQTIESVARLYFDPRFACFAKSVYRRLSRSPSWPSFRHKFETLTKPSGVKFAGEIEKVAGPENWGSFLERKPTAGSFYRIRGGDTLVGVARRAYGKTTAFWGAQYINFHPFNRRLWRTDKASRKLWPKGRIAFNPLFEKNEDFQVTKLAGVAEAPSGRSFGVIYIPFHAFEFEFNRRDLTPGRIDVLRFDVKGFLELEEVGA